ncbi:MAG: hypothetical protein ACREAU_00305 [Nitrosopumilaceae archaeon]
MTEDTTRERLRGVLDNIIDGKPEDAEIKFRDYLSVKSREVVGDDAKQRPNEEKKNGS